MAVKRLQGGPEHKNKNQDDFRLFNRRARTAILSVAAIIGVCVFIIPVTLNGMQAVNASSTAVLEAAEAAPLPTPTPIPESLYDVSSGHDLSAAATPTPAAGLHVSKYTLLQENDDFESVKNLQLRLMELGYLDSDEPSTKFGHATTMAVSLYQRTVDVDMNGIADSALQEKLFSADATPYEMKISDSGADVKSMQSRLHELGYFSDKISGYFGAATENAVKAFQKKNKLDVDGVFDSDDRDLLFSPEARPAIDPTPTPTPTPKRTPKPTSKPTPKPTKKPTGASSPGDDSGSDEDPGSGGSFSASHSADGLVSVAKAQQGKPYEWSEEGPNSFDCSGLVYYSLRTCGVKISRYSASGFSGVSSWENVSSIGSLKKGDLVFFKSDSSSSVNHTGIYIGSSKFVHASSSAGKVIISNITTSYWTRNFMNGRRVF